MVTPEQVRDLIEHGSMQLGPEHLPEKFLSLIQMAARPDPRHRRIFIDEVVSVLPGFLEIGNEIITQAGYRQIAQPILETEVKIEKGANDYPNLHTDYGGRRSGISFLFSPALPGQANSLLTAGREKRWDMSQAITYRYCDGPIVIAQTGFGATEESEADRYGATWHGGQRTGTAPFVAIDWLSVYRP